MASKNQKKKKNCNLDLQTDAITEILTDSINL